MGVLFYIIYKGIVNRKIIEVIHLLLTVLFGLILSLPQIIPSMQLYAHSVRSELFLLSEVIPFPYLITIISPDFLGNPVTRNDWFGHYAEWAGFIGFWPLLLALISIFSNVKKSLFFFLLGIFSLVMAINSPLANLLVSLKIPVISTSAFSRIIVLFSFCFAVLAGLGFDELKTALTKKKNPRTIVICLCLSAVFLVAVWALLFFGKSLPDQWLIVAKRNFVLPSVLFLGGAFLILLALKFKRLMLLALFYLLLAISFDSLRFAQKWMPFDDKKLVYPQVAVIKAIKQNIGQGRIFGNLGAEVLSYYGFLGIEGYDPLYLARYGEFIRGSQGNGKLSAERSVVRLPRRAPFTDRVLDLLGVSLVFQPIADTNQGWAYPVWAKQDRYDLVYQDDKFQLYKNKKALPRVSLFYDYDVIKNDNEILQTLYNQNFDFRKTLILENDPGIKLSSPGTGEAKIISYSPDEIIVDVLTKSPALLFLADNYYPTWKAEVNGKETDIFRTDYTFRSVLVPQGASKVRFTERWF